MRRLTIPREFSRSEFGVEFEPPRDDLPPPPKGRGKRRWDLVGLLRDLQPGQSIALRRPDGMDLAGWQAQVGNAAKRLWGKGGHRTHAEDARTVRVWRLQKEDGADA